MEELSNAVKKTLVGLLQGPLSLEDTVENPFSFHHQFRLPEISGCFFTGKNHCSQGGSHSYPCLYISLAIASESDFLGFTDASL